MKTSIEIVVSKYVNLSTHIAGNYEQQTRNAKLLMLRLSSINWKKKNYIAIV